MAGKTTLPGPEGRWLVGSFFDLDTKKLLPELTEWSVKYGPIYQFSSLGNTAVVITSADLMKEAFQTNGRAVAGRPYSIAGNVADNNDIAFSARHEDNPALREVFLNCLYSHPLLQTRIQQGTQDAMATLTTRLSELVGQNVDIRKSTQLAHINFATNMLIGETLDESDPDHVAFDDFIHGVHAIFKSDIKFKLTLFPFLKYVPWSTAGQALRDLIAARDRIYRKYFTEHKATWQQGKPRGMVDVCLDLQHENSPAFPLDEQIQGIILDMVFAGTGQHTKALRGVFMLMCANIEEQKLVQKEIDEHIGRDEIPSIDKKKDMPYTQAVIFESSRYATQTPLAITHVCVQDVTVGGYHLPQGTMVIPNIWGVHNSETIWGDPWVFRPNRFLDDSGNLLSADSDVMKNLLPFSIGTRQCPGKQLAMTYLFLCTTAVLQKFTILPADGVEFPSTDSRLYSPLYPYDEPDFKCKVVSRE